MTYQEFLKLVDQTSNNFNWRYGQALMNVLYAEWKDKCNEIMESDCDPYDNEECVPKILKDLKESWRETKNS